MERLAVAEDPFKALTGVAARVFRGYYALRGFCYTYAGGYVSRENDTGGGMGPSIIRQRKEFECWSTGLSD